MKENETCIQFLKGKRVSLRPVLKEDVPQFLRWMNDPDVLQYLGMSLPTMEVEEDQWFEGLAKKKQNNLIFAVVTVEGKLIGTMGLHNIIWADRTATTGAVIGDKAYWNKGYGTEAKMLLLNFAFNTLNLRKICSSVFAFNKRSYAYQKKCGYVEEGRRLRQRYRKGRYQDELLMAVFKKYWLPLWRAYQKAYLQ